MTARILRHSLILSLSLPALCAAAFVALQSPAAAADPGDPAAKPLCCAVPPRDEATADHVVGRWIVTEAGEGAPVKPGQRLVFGRDGAVTTSLGACRYAILRGELTLTCSFGTSQGELEFVDEETVVWRVEGQEPVTITPAD